MADNDQTRLARLRFRLGEMEEQESGRDRLLLSTTIDLVYQHPEEFLRLYDERRAFETRLRGTNAVTNEPT